MSAWKWADGSQEIEPGCKRRRPMDKLKHQDRLSAEYNQFLEALNYREAQQYLVEESWPRFLYKFRPLQSEKDLDRLRQITVDSNLWLSSPESFNDPFDMKARFIATAPPDKRRKRYTAIMKKQGHTSAEIPKLLPRYMRMSEAEIEAQI